MTTTSTTDPLHGREVVIRQSHAGRAGQVGTVMRVFRDGRFKALDWAEVDFCDGTSPVSIYCDDITPLPPGTRAHPVMDDYDMTTHYDRTLGR